MAYEQRDGDVSIFKNDKQGNEKRPDYAGTAMIDGREYKVALWIKEGKRGKFFGGKIEPKQQSGTYESPRSMSQPRQPKPEPARTRLENDAIPF